MLFSLAALCLIVVAPILAHGQDRPAGDGGSIDAEVLEVLMPMRTAALQARDTEWILQIRVRERGEPEFWSRITRRYREDGSPYSAHVRQLWPHSLDRQLDRIREAAPSATVRDLAAKVMLRERHIDSCPTADTFLQRLEQLAIPVLLDDTIELDASSYELNAVFRGGSVAIQLRGAQAGERLRETLRQIATSLIDCL